MTDNMRNHHTLQLKARRDGLRTEINRYGYNSRRRNTLRAVNNELARRDQLNNDMYSTQSL